VKFDATMRDLGEIPVAGLKETILAQDAQAWSECDMRQRSYDVHHDTESIVLLFCDQRWPDPAVSRMAGWPRLSAVAEPLMHDIIARCYAPGGVILRAMAAKLKVGGRIAPHIDSQPSFAGSHRIHLPVTTNPGVRFTIDGRPCLMQVGRAYEINNQLPHSVMNAGSEDRITFIFDYVPPAAA
jgi:hypothetical protein